MIAEEAFFQCFPSAFQFGLPFKNLLQRFPHFVLGIKGRGVDDGHLESSGRLGRSGKLRPG
jgi:hypothetical protein